MSATLRLLYKWIPAFAGMTMLFLPSTVFASETSYTYTNQEQDKSGLMHYDSRYYDPELGRFLQPDTFDVPNKYAYVSNDPVNRIDPSGHFDLFNDFYMLMGFDPFTTDSIPTLNIFHDQMTADHIYDYGLDNLLFDEISPEIEKMEFLKGDTQSTPRDLEITLKQRGNGPDFYPGTLTLYEQKGAKALDGGLWILNTRLQPSIFQRHFKTGLYIFVNTEELILRENYQNKNILIKGVDAYNSYFEAKAKGFAGDKINNLIVPEHHIYVESDVYTGLIPNSSIVGRMSKIAVDSAGFNKPITLEELRRDSHPNRSTYKILQDFFGK